VNLLVVEHDYLPYSCAGRSYVRVFSPRRQPTFMRELYCDYVLW
jgi:hypothetical protein